MDSKELKKLIEIGKDTEKILDGIKDIQKAVVGPKQASPVAVSRLEAMRRHPSYRGDEAAVLVTAPVKLDWEDPDILGTARVTLSDRGYVSIQINLDEVESDRVNAIVDLLGIKALRLSVVEPS